MDEISDIRYAPEHGLRGEADLLLPDQPSGAAAALSIHGGGWNAMDKYSWSGVAQLMCEQGLAAFNINYRLLDIAPWPACGDDCVRAAEFLLAAGHPAMKPLDRSRGLVIIGGSAGGHLALWTALHLPPGTVRAVISVAGPTDLFLRIGQRGREAMCPFFGVSEADKITDAMLREASPVSYVTADAPPLLCVHSTNDRLVPLEHSQRMVDAYAAVGARAELFAYAGPGQQHGIWIEGSDPHRLLPEPANAICNFLRLV